MKKTLFLLLLICQLCAAQPAAVQKIAVQISSESLKKNLYYLASDKMEGRLMGSHGDTLASLFIADWFKKNKITAPYENGKSYLQAITAYKITTDATIAINGNSYPKAGNYFTSRNFSSIKDASILIPFFNDPDSLYNALGGINSQGKVVLLPAAVRRKIGSEEGITRYAAKLATRGIIATVSSDPAMQLYLNILKDREFLPRYGDSTSASVSPSKSVSEIGLSETKMNEILAADNLTTKQIGSIIALKGRTGFLELQTKLNIEEKKSIQKTHAPNVIGMIKGSDPDADCIVVSAHHDHDGKNGKEIYYGAVDNASGSVAIMEMAASMNRAVQKGFRPKRSIIFASFTGEERGLLGSSYYVEHPVLPIKKTMAVMNIDMMGRVDTLYSGKKADSTYAYILVKDSLNIGLRTSLMKANESVKLTLDTRYEQPQYAQRRIRGSDQFPFYKKGVPFLRIDCGFAIDYHKPTDTPDKINYPLLTKQTQLAFLTLWNMANQ